MPEQSPIISIVESFSKYGYSSGIPVINEAEAAILKTQIESIVQSHEHPLDAIRNVHLHFPWAFDILNAPEIIKPVSAILGADILVRGVLVLIKRPHSSSVVLWHSDHAYSSTSPTPQVSAWLALSPSFLENGCMKVVPGSHREIHAHQEAIVIGNQLTRNLTVVHPPDPENVVNLNLEPGQMSLHDPVILHASGPNETDIPRIGFIIRYVTPEYEPSQRPMIRILGNTPCPHLNIVEPVFADNFNSCVQNLIAYNQINKPQ